jgi:hypothetical protein
MSGKRLHTTPFLGGNERHRNAGFGGQSVLPRCSTIGVWDRRFHGYARGVSGAPRKRVGGEHSWAVVGPAGRFEPPGPLDTETRVPHARSEIFFALDGALAAVAGAAQGSDLLLVATLGFDSVDADDDRRATAADAQEDMARVFLPEPRTRTMVVGK